MHSISIAPNFLVSGAVVPEDGALPSNTADRLLELLAAGNFIGTVEDNPARGPEDDLTFTLACDADMRMLKLGKSGKLVAGKLLENLETELQRDLGQIISLTQEFEDEDDDEEFEDLDFTEAFDSIGLSEAVSLLESEYAEDADEDEDDQDDWVADTPAWEDHDVPPRALIFSKRGVGSAALVSWIAKGSVEAGEAGGWSAFRYLDNSYSEVPLLSNQELPSVQLEFADGEPDGTAYVEVSTLETQGAWAHTLLPGETRHNRAVLKDIPQKSQAAELQAVLMNANLNSLSDANKIIADPQLTVDAETLHAALAPEFEGTTAERVEQLLVAMGLPPELVQPAVRGARLPNQQRFDARRIWHMILQLAEQGHAGTRPLGSKAGVLERAETTLRNRPLLGYAVAAAEAALGVAVLAFGARSRGAKRALGIVGGLLCIGDAALDTFVLRKRTR